MRTSTTTSATVRRRAVALPIGVLLALAPAAVSASAQARSATVEHAAVVLHGENGSAARGTAKLAWNRRTHVLTVDVRASDLPARSRHPEHIHAGSCAPGNGAVVYPLHDVVANRAGRAHTTTRVHNVTTVEFSGGWYLNVHHGPTMAAGPTPIACGDVVRR